MAPMDPFTLMCKKAQGKKKAAQASRNKEPQRVVHEVAPEQPTQGAISCSSTQEEPIQPPQVVEVDEPEMVTEQPPGGKRAQTEVEASELPGSSSREEVWAPVLRAGKRLITTKDSLLGTSNIDVSARITHGLGAAMCLPEDIKAWDAMPSGKVFRQIAHGLFTVSFGV